MADLMLNRNIGEAGLSDRCGPFFMRHPERFEAAGQIGYRVAERFSN
jgi:hypothetical protein